MSLLMQALRKAERARVQNGHEAEHTEPQFGQESVPSPPPMEGGPAFAVMPDAWRLEPLEAEPPIIPAQEAAHDPVPPQARHEARRAPLSSAAAPPSPALGQTAQAWPDNELPTGAASGFASESAVRAGPHAPQPARAIASSQRRLGLLLAALLGLLLVFGAIYWRAVSGPGPGAKLPMVPMPAAGLPQMSPGSALPGAGIPVAPYLTPPSSNGSEGQVGSSDPSQLATQASIAARAAEAGTSGAPLAAGADAARAADAGASGAGAARATDAEAGGMGAARVTDAGAGGIGATRAADAGASSAGATRAADAGASGAGAARATAAGAGGMGAARAADAGAAGVLGAGANAAPATRPYVDVTVPTPEQLAAITDPAIRAEAMRDAAERAARQARSDYTAAPADSGSAAGAMPAAAAVITTPRLSASGAPVAALDAIGSAAAPIQARSGGTPRTASATRKTDAANRPASNAARARPLAADGATRQVQAQAQAASGVEGKRRSVPTAVGESGDVRFVRGAAPSGIAPAVQNGYNALRSGDLPAARQQYDLALLQDPNNRDALLGAAAVARQEGDGRQASSNYLRLLELDPNDPDALAALAELRGGDLEANEVKLKGVARKHPDSGPVQFALGNLFARQGRWPEAQQSYFRAYSAVPDNADYAYNLGVGLDRLNQPRLAQTYYRRALELAQASPPAFNIEAVRKRLQTLETPPH